MIRKIDLDRNWLFLFDRDSGEFASFGLRKCGAATGPAAVFYHEGLMRRVDVPHDWGVELAPDRRANTEAGARPISPFVPADRSPDGDTHLPTYAVGWYRRHIPLDDSDRPRRVLLEFEGVFRDYILFVNGVYIDRHASGYTAAVFDVTEVMRPGDNVVAVRVDASQPEGWWYEGAGIYRHVRMILTDEVYIPCGATFVKARVSGAVTVETTVYSASDAERKMTLRCRVLDAAGACVASADAALSVPPRGTAPCALSCTVPAPRLWSVDDPALYRAVLEALTDGPSDPAPEEKQARTSSASAEESEPLLLDETVFGFREVVFDPDRGMFLNGRHLKLRGACLHQDFGGFGVALPASVAAYKIHLLKTMGVNAVRSSHHPASDDLLRACDEAGMLVIDETRLFGASPEALRQLDDMVTRHRNHPSIILWSLGNEEYVEQVQSTDAGERMAAVAYRRLKALDDTRPVTFGANNGSADGGVNAVVDVRGFNYVRNVERLTVDSEGRHVPGGHADRYHAEHPAAVMLGTEEGSHFLCRGAGIDDFAHGRVLGTGEHTAMGGSTPDGWVRFYEARDYLAGAFMWSGIDYLGEPAPFTDRNLSSSFGAIDLVGIPKHTFHYYRSCWTDEPVLEILPHWDFCPGERVRVAVYSNCEHIALTLNGRPVGEKTLAPFDCARFDLDFEPGVLEAVGERRGETLRARLQTPKAAAKLLLTPVADPVTGEVLGVDAAVADADGVVCARSDRPVTFSVEGGRIVGVGNGDPACFEPDKYLPRVVTRPLDGWRVSRGGGPSEPYPVPPIDDRTGVVDHGGVDSVFKRAIDEPRNPRYEDEHRLVWQFSTGEEKTLEATFEAVFDDDGDSTFVEFERLFGAFEVFLNGVLIGRSFPVDHFHPGTLYRPAPYRFAGRFVRGENRLTVVMRGPDTRQMGVYGGVRTGREEPPVWRRSTFFGHARAFLLPDADGATAYTVTAAAEGLTPARLTLPR
ncbi:MAG: DUF4982 domain-containing protein [Clostridia bacterium]|nr:DUF4982 domain-containing protein [Clostridia bacterium]